MGYLYYAFGLSLVVILSSYISGSHALQCYDCNSYSDKRCLGDLNNKLDDELKKNCPDKTPDGKPYVLCRKIKQFIDFEVNGLQPENRVIRNCGWDDSHYNNRCYQRSGFGGRQEVCACQGENCNTGTSVTSSTIICFVAAVVVGSTFRLFF